MRVGGVTFVQSVKKIPEYKTAKKKRPLQVLSIDIIKSTTSRSTEDAGFIHQ